MTTSFILLATALVQQPASVPAMPPRNDLERLILAPGDHVISSVQTWVDAHAGDPNALQSAMTQAGFGPRLDDPECWFRHYERVVAIDGLRIKASIRFCDGRKPVAFVMYGYPYPAQAPRPGDRSGILYPKTKE